MNRFYYDLHIHSCLSPCADNDNTPNNIAGMGKLNELDIMALTDHNTSKNCPAFFAAAEKNGIIPIAGMELTTSEDIHAVCLFETLDDALGFSDEIDARRIKIKNKTEIFGEQLIMNCEDELIGTDDYLLSNATTVSLDEVGKIVERYRGVCYPAHIDRDSNGAIAVLGAFPYDDGFKAAEIRDKLKAEEYIAKYKLESLKLIFSSDAHYLWDISEKENYFDLPCDKNDPNSVRHELFKYLRCEE